MAKHRKSSSKEKSLSRHNSNTIRIIGGKWRGRKLGFPSIEGLRPTGDRMRETLFNWVAAEIPGARVIDLFAGSGSLGFESLSREASQVTFVEMNAQAAKSIEQNIQLLDARNARVQQKSAFDYLNTLEPNSCDLLFVDPPFNDGLYDDTLSLVNSQNIMRKGALLYVEAPVDYSFAFPAEWAIYRDKTSGHVRYRLFQC